LGYAAIFPGQGSQAIGMADPWAVDPTGLAVLEEASAAIGRDVVAGCHDEEALATTEFVQPALLACGVAAFRVLDARGIAPWVGAAGHSLGEFGALVAADVLTLAEALGIVVIRGRAMQRAGEERPGTMAAVLGVDAEGADALCAVARDGDVLLVANLNSPVQSVVSGSIAAVERLEAIAKERKIRAVRLNVAGAFHSPLMEPAIAEIDEAIDHATFRQPRFPIAENVSGDLVSDRDELVALLKRHVISPVRWEGCVRALASAGASTFLECGGDVLTKLQKRIDPEVRAIAVTSPAADVTR
jgi:[acyl-carrier-protein] S-malonyltransferase